LAAAYDRAAVVVMPSRWPEPFGITGLEAFSRGRPVVAFGVGGIPEWLDDGVSGCVVPPGDTRALAARVAWLLAHRDQAAAMGARGRERVARDFSAARHLAQLVPLYSRLPEPARG
jgi:glycosyltransferase involved in cell wall biosynthesis